MCKDRKTIHAYISHHVNNPLTVILGRVALLANKKVISDEILWDLTMIEESAHRILRVIREEFPEFLEKEVTTWDYNKMEEKNEKKSA